MKFDANPETGGANEFLKLKDKESVTGVFRGEVFEFYGSWKEGKFVVGEGKQFRFRINFITKDEAGNYVAKVWEQGVTIYGQLKDLHAEYNLPETVVKITRSGSGPSDTSYTILPAKNSVVTPALEKILAAVELKDLSHQEKTKTHEPSFDEMETIPF